MPRHDADLAFTGGDDARAVGTDETAVAAVEGAFHPHHVENGNALGDADDQRHAGVYRLEDRIRGKGRRDVNDRRVGLGLTHRLGNRIEHRQAEMRLPALAWGDTTDHGSAVIDRLFGMEGALRAGEALADDPGLLVYENRHGTSPVTRSRRRFSPLRRPDCQPE